MKVLSLNCQKAYQPGLKPFLQKTLEGNFYDVLLLQEASEEVLDFLDSTHGYAFLTAQDAVVGKRSMLCIAYRTSISLTAQDFHSFAAMRYDPVAGYKHLGFGFLCGKFEVEGDNYCFGTLHFHAGVDAKVRRKELMRMKETVLAFAQQTPVIVGGDCNFGYPWELLQACRTLLPELTCITRRLGDTLNSRYAEYVDHLPNKIAFWLSRVGISIKLKTDHFILSSGFARAHAVSTRILPDRVSDHSPIELVIEGL
jgi:hypothetical protein